MKILIKVTKAVLVKSAMCLGPIYRNCAVAVAAQEMFPKAEMGLTMLMLNDETCCILEVPKQVTDFVNEFDASTPAERINLPEFSFEIEVPSSVIDKIGIQEAYRILSESKTLELVHP